MSAGSQRIEGHAGEQAVAAMRAFGIDVMFTLNGGHIWPLYEACPQPGRARRRHPPRAVGDVRRRGLRQADPPPGRGRADRRTGHHQRRLGGDVGVVQRLAAGRARRPGPAAALGRRVAAGARPRADPRLDHQVGGDRHSTPSKAGTLVHEAIAPGRRAAPRAGVPRLPARRVRPVGRRRSRRSIRRPGGAPSPIPTSIARLAELVAGAERPAFIVGSDVYWAGAWERAARRPSSTCGCRCFTNGLGRGTLPADHELAFLRTRGPAQAAAPTSSSCSARRSTSASGSAASAAATWPTSSTPSRSGPPTSTC